jgi:hypothetical protein
MLLEGFYKRDERRKGELVSKEVVDGTQQR